MFFSAIAAALIVALAQPASPSAIAQPPPTSASTLPIDDFIRGLSNRDIGRLNAARYFVRAQYIKTPSERMPRNDPFFHYVGMDGSRNTLIWMNERIASIFTNSTEQNRATFGDRLDGYWAADTATHVLAIAMQGGAGDEWQRRFKDAPDRIGLARAIVPTAESRMARSIAKTQSDIAFVHANLQVGMPCPQVFALLESWDVIAFNENFHVDVLTARGPCNWAAHHSENWVRPEQPVAQLVASFSLGVQREARSAMIRYFNGGGGNPQGCIHSIDQTFVFDDNDRLQSIGEVKSQLCY